MEALMTVEEVAGLLNVCCNSVYRLTQKRDGLRCYKVAGRLRFKRAEVEDWIEAQAVKPPEKAAPFVRGHFKYTPGMKVV